MKTQLDKKLYNTDTGIASCPITEIWQLLGKRWSLSILYTITKNKTIRFNELKKSLSEISATVLSERLSELESQGLITKKMFAEIPPRVEYSLSPKTSELGKIIEELNDWVKKWKSK